MSFLIHPSELSTDDLMELTVYYANLAIRSNTGRAHRYLERMAHYPARYYEMVRIAIQQVNYDMVRARLLSLPYQEGKQNYDQRIVKYIISQGSHIEFQPMEKQYL